GRSPGTWEGETEAHYARPRVIRGTRVKPLPLLPSGPGGVRSRPLHEARSLTTFNASSFLEAARSTEPDSAGRLHQFLRLRRPSRTRAAFGTRPRIRVHLCSSVAH